MNVQSIWRAKRKFCRRTIHERKSDRLDHEQIAVQDLTLSTFPGNNTFAIAEEHQHTIGFLLESLPTSMRSIVESRQINMHQRLRQILTFKNISLSQ